MGPWLLILRMGRIGDINFGLQVETGTALGAATLEGSPLEARTGSGAQADWGRGLPFSSLAGAPPHLYYEDQPRRAQVHRPPTSRPPARHP